jgi:hypothetical protein
MFEHNILASVLALISKICALILCYVSHRKCLPLMVLQFFTAICYFLLSSVDFDPKDSSNCGIAHCELLLSKPSRRCCRSVALESI